MTLQQVEVDVAVVGAGPAGIAAAAVAAEAGARVLLLDESPTLGGQIWRRREGEGAHLPRAANAWLRRLARSGAGVAARTSVVDASPGELLVVRDAQARRVRAGRLILASGARELFLPFPGWTLANVIGVGAAQGLAKSGATWRGLRVVVAGSGPLLLPVAATLTKAGARVALVAEQARLADVARFALGLTLRPAKLALGLLHRLGFARAPYRFGCHVLEARGDASVRDVLLSDGARTWSEPCDVLACAFGLSPNTELARLLGCDLVGDALAVDGAQRSSLTDVFAAGEITGVAGAEAALLQGQIAGRSAVGESADAHLSRARDAERAFGRTLVRAFAPRDELRRLVRDDTLVCRCEDVAWAHLREARNARAAKLHTRAGMGACQGRVCGAALRFLCGFEVDRVRPPLSPVPIAALLEEGPASRERQTACVRASLGAPRKE